MKDSPILDHTPTRATASIDRAMAIEAAEREKFEAWAKASTQLKVDRDIASYLSGTTQFAWMAWIERAAPGVEGRKP